MTRPRLWTPEDDRRFVHLRQEERMTFAELAEAFGCSRPSARNHALALGLEPVRGWTDDEIQRLTRLWKEGAPLNHMGIVFRCHRNTIRKKAAELGLPSRSGKKTWVSKALPREKPKPSTKKTRLCLCCRQPFASEWIGHRVCESCKHISSWRVGEDFSLSAARTHRRAGIVGGGDS